MPTFFPQGWIMALGNLVPKHLWPTTKETWTSLWSANFNGVQPQKPQCLCTETKESHARTKSRGESRSNNLIATLQITVMLSFTSLKTPTTSRSWCLSIQFFYSDRLLPALEFAAGRTGPWTKSIRQTLEWGKGRNICCHHEQLVGCAQQQRSAKQLICFPFSLVWLGHSMSINLNHPIHWAQSICSGKDGSQRHYLDWFLQKVKI